MTRIDVVRTHDRTTWRGPGSGGWCPGPRPLHPLLCSVLLDGLTIQEGTGATFSTYEWGGDVLAGATTADTSPTTRRARPGVPPA